MNSLFLSTTLLHSNGSVAFDCAFDSVEFDSLLGFGSADEGRCGAMSDEEEAGGAALDRAGFVY